MGFPITKMRSSANQTPHCRFSTVRRNTSRSDQTEKYFCLTIWNRPRFNNSTCFPRRTRTCVHTCALLKPSPTAGNSQSPQVLLTGQHPRGEIGSLYAAKRKKEKKKSRSLNAWMNASYDLNALCREFPQRLADVQQAEGDRLRK